KTPGRAGGWRRVSDPSLDWFSGPLDAIAGQVGPWVPPVTIERPGARERGVVVAVRLAAVKGRVHEHGGQPKDDKSEED
ncbi:hypothetical protein, partial [Vineibacter terrae]|uniref:hypothetical protein n=1 Tax=Vineibacter terrae TaxID=2586908 RepID=UPI002E2EC31A